MNIGGRYEVAVRQMEYSAAQRSATASHAGGRVSVRGCRVSEPSVRDCGLRWREGVALMFVRRRRIVVLVFVGWLMGVRMEEDDC